MKNEIGNRYGKLVVLSRGENDNNGKARWYCQCDCGNIILARGTDLRRGKTKTCGCSSIKAEQSLVGQRFGALEVIEFTRRNNSNKLMYRCKCDCGNEIEVIGQHLKNGNTKSCGCYRKQVNSSRFTKDEVGKVYGRLSVLEYDSNHGNEAWWKCQCECGNIVSVRGADLRSGNTKSCGCVKSEGEARIIKILTENNIKFKSQFSFSDLVYKKPLKYDFAILDEDEKVIRLIEFDGPQHTDKENNWYTVEGELRDSMKNAYAFANNIPLVRIPYKEKDNLNYDLLFSDTYLMRDMKEML